MAATADTPIDLTARRARRPRQPAAASFDALFRAEHGPLMRIALALTDLIATTARTDD